MLMEEEGIQQAKIELIKKKAEGKKNALGGVDIGDDQVSTSEVCIFVAFTVFLMICVYQQLDISTNYETNHAISNWVNNSTFNN